MAPGRFSKETPMKKQNSFGSYIYQRTELTVDFFCLFALLFCFQIFTCCQLLYCVLCNMYKLIQAS